MQPRQPDDLSSVQHDINQAGMAVTKGAFLGLEEMAEIALKIQRRQVSAARSPTPVRLEEEVTEAPEEAPHILERLNPASESWEREYRAQTVAAFDGQLYRSDYDSYVSVNRSHVPAEQTLSVARSAIRDGRTPEQVVEILNSDPEVQRLVNEQGAAEASQYARQAVAAAVRKEAVAAANRGGAVEVEVEEHVDPSYAIDLEIDADIEIEPDE